MRSGAALLLLLLSAPSWSRAQGLQDRDSHQRLSLGFGMDAGEAGLTYAYRPGRSPFEFGAGGGVEGLGPFVHLVVPGLDSDNWTENRDAYIGVGLLAGTRGQLAHSGLVVVDVVMRFQIPHGRVYMIGGFSSSYPVWGHPTLGMAGLAFPHFGVGYAF